MPDASNLDLKSILNREKSKLSTLDPDFYDKVSDYLKGLDELRKTASPDSTKENMLTHQLETSKNQVGDFIEARMRNIVRQAQLQAWRKNSGDDPALTRDELDFYNGLLQLMTEWKRNRIEQVFGKKPEKKVLPPQIKEERTGFVQKVRNISEYVMCRLLKDVPTFVGMDNRNYTLAAQDVVLIPAVNARALIEKKAAVQIKTKS